MWVVPNKCLSCIRNPWRGRCFRRFGHSKQGSLLRFTRFPLKHLPKCGERLIVLICFSRHGLSEFLCPRFGLRELRLPLLHSERSKQVGNLLPVRGELPFGNLVASVSDTL